MAKKLECTECKKYLGEINNGLISKHIVYICNACHDKFKNKDFVNFIGILKNGR